MVSCHPPTLACHPSPWPLGVGGLGGSILTPLSPFVVCLAPASTTVWTAATSRTPPHPIQRWRPLSSVTRCPINISSRSYPDLGFWVSFRDPSLPSPAQPGILSPVTPSPPQLLRLPSPPWSVPSWPRSARPSSAQTLSRDGGLSLWAEATGPPPPLLQVFALVPSPLSLGAYLLTCYVMSQCVVRGVCLCPLLGHRLAVLRVASPCSLCSLSPCRSPGGTTGGGGVCGTRVTCSILPACLLSGDFLQRTLSVPPTVKVVWFWFCLIQNPQGCRINCLSWTCPLINTETSCSMCPHHRRIQLWQLRLKHVKTVLRTAWERNSFKKPVSF